MVIRKNFWALIVFLFVIAGCATRGGQERQNLRAMISAKNWQGALDLVDQSDFFKQDKSRLLGFLEKGTIHHYQGEYQASIDSFIQANDLARQLFTRSLSSQAKTLVANDSFDDYFGAPYERSMIYFYQALNYYQLAQNISEQERQNFLYAARAEIIAWDAHLQTLKRDREGAVYKEDLLARLYGGLIHESLGSRDEQQIALQLYKDALDILTKYTSAYQSFNLKSSQFVANYKKLPELSLAQVKKDYLTATVHYDRLENYLKRKVLELTHHLFPQDMAQIAKTYQMQELASEMKTQRPLSNVVVVIKEGLVAPVVASEQYYGLDHAKYDSEGARALAQIGAVAFSLFAMNVLGLTPAPRHWTPVGHQLGLEVGYTLAQGLAISFELPQVEQDTSLEAMDLIATHLETGVEHKFPLALVHSLSDISRQALAEDAIARYARTGLRVAVKHAVAIAASYATYQLLNKDKDEGPSFLARNAAVFQYVAASRAIALSERADTRHWTSLPKAVRLIDFYLPAGEYTLRLEGSNRIIQLENLHIPATGDGKIFHLSQLP